jgi:hypothetical protein
MVGIAAYCTSSFHVLLLAEEDTAAGLLNLVNLHYQVMRSSLLLGEQ